MKHTMRLPHLFIRPHHFGITLTRLVVGSIWLAGATYNALVTWAMSDPYGWIADDSVIPLWRWFFTNVVERQPELWTALLIAGELLLGVLTLGRSRWAQFGLLGGAIFSVVLFSLGTPYTLMMGPYAVFLIWLSRHDAEDGVLHLLWPRHQPAREVGQ